MTLALLFSAAGGGDAAAGAGADSDCPLRRQAAAVLCTNLHLFVYAGQDLPSKKAWSGAQEARGVADAFAASLTGVGRSPDERVPMWNTVTKRALFGKGERPSRPTERSTDGTTDRASSPRLTLCFLRGCRDMLIWFHDVHDSHQPGLSAREVSDVQVKISLSSILRG